MKKCKYCKIDIDSKAKICPNCKKKQGMPVWKIVLIVFGVLFVIGLFGGEDNSANGTNSGTNSESSSTAKPSKELTESEKMLNKIVELIDEGLAYDTGSYIKGDITPGDYAFIKFSGSGSYYCEKDAANNIIDNENFDSFGYVKVHGAGNLETQAVLVNVSAFEKLGVTGAKQIYELLNNQTNYNQGGYYKVGTDIEPGSYVVESMGGSGYYAILSGPVSNSEIIDNDNFSGRAAVNLTNGQYIEITRSTITKQ